MYTPLHHILRSLGMHLEEVPADLWSEPEPGDFLPPIIGDIVEAPLGNHDCLTALVLEIRTDEKGEDWYHLEYSIMFRGQPDTTTLWLPYSAFDPMEVLR